MPTLITPPHTERKPERRHDIGEGDNGSGRRPPTDKRTGGNGDGDNWNNHPQRRRGPRDRISSARVGLFFALGGDLMFFVALVSVFFVNKSSGHFDAYSHYINSWLPTAIPSILWLNTAVLLLSSVSAEIARQGMFDERKAMDEWIGLGRPISARASIWLGVTLVLGTLFLGIGALIAALIALQRSRSMSTRQVLVDSTVWYWHVMGILWIFLFALLEWGQ
jgi:cytochrome c oxidase subunit 3